jgi:hypothetical protein
MKMQISLGNSVFHPKVGLSGIILRVKLKISYPFSQENGNAHVVPYAWVHGEAWNYSSCEWNNNWSGILDDFQNRSSRTYHIGLLYQTDIALLDTKPQIDQFDL